MTYRRTPHGALLPDNYNTNQRPPRTMNLHDPQVVNFLTAPNLLQRLSDLSRSDPRLYNELTTDLLQHRRALNGDRALPGQYNGNDALPFASLPFAPKDDYRPDRTPDTHAGKVTRQAVERLDADLLTRGLQSRLASNSPDNPDSTWNRSNGPTGSVERSDRSTPPTLHESVAASFDAHVSNSGD